MGLNILPVFVLPEFPGAGTAIAASLYPNPAKPANRWRLAWSDEFNGPPCDPAAPGKCTARDWQKTVQCYGTPDTPVGTVTPFAFHVDPGDPRQWTTQVHPHLANLDKCTWLVSDHVNKIHFQGPAGPITRYSPNSVTVSNGEMRITTRRTRPATVDCGRVISAERPEQRGQPDEGLPLRGGQCLLLRHARPGGRQRHFGEPSPATATCSARAGASRSGRASPQRRAT